MSDREHELTAAKKLIISNSALLRRIEAVHHIFIDVNSFLNSSSFAQLPEMFKGVDLVNVSLILQPS